MGNAAHATRHDKRARLREQLSDDMPRSARRLAKALLAGDGPAVEEAMRQQPSLVRLVEADGRLEGDTLEAQIRLLEARTQRLRAQQATGMRWRSSRRQTYQ